jgi:hypothetical protein
VNTLPLDILSALPAAAGALAADDMVYEVAEGEGRRRRLKAASWLGWFGGASVPDIMAPKDQVNHCQPHCDGSKSVASQLSSTRARGKAFSSFTPAVHVRDLEAYPTSPVPSEKAVMNAERLNNSFCAAADILPVGRANTPVNPQMTQSKLGL